MNSICRVSASKLGSGGLSMRLCKASNNHNVVPVAFMVRDAFLEKVNRPPPFPYWKKGYRHVNTIFDPIMNRYYENSKVIVVEGQPAMGKSKFAEQLADQFKMLYMPVPTIDDYYKNPYGFDLRTLDSKLPPGAQSVDLAKFLSNPKKYGAQLQYQFLQMRFEQYLNAMCHILMTGQGVVLDRCFYTDIVFAEAMYSFGYIRKEVLDYFYILRNKVYHYFLRPHLLIYLDAPVETVKDKIRKRGVPEEVNSEVLSTKYLSEIEKKYKELYLTEMSSHSHLLMYDWSKEYDIMRVVEEIEDLDFDSQKDQTGKLGDWIYRTVAQLKIHVRFLAQKRKVTLRFLQAGSPNIPHELLMSGADTQAYDDALDEIPSEMYDQGFNPEMGDSYFWKKGLKHEYTFRKNMRDFVNRDKFMS